VFFKIDIPGENTKKKWCGMASNYMNLFDVVQSNPTLRHHIQESVYNALKIYARAEIVPKSHYFKSHAADIAITVIGMLNIKDKENTSILSLFLAKHVNDNPHTSHLMVYI
jgi:hypothetical protein